MSPTRPIAVFGIEQTASPDELLALRKRELRNLLTSYADEADVFAEIIQNAFDAVVAAWDQHLYDRSSSPRLDIVVGRRSGDPHYLIVCDNGVGMSRETAGRFTTPGYTANKALGHTIGYKGVGASFFFAASNCVALQTEDAAGVKTIATVKDSFRWIMSTSEPTPEVRRAFPCPQNARPFLPNGRGTAIYYEFHDGLKPRSLSHIVRREDEPYRELRHWASYLCAKTALGQVDPKRDIPIRVGIHLDCGEDLESRTWSLGEFDLDDHQLGYPYPWRVFRVHKDIAELDAIPGARRVVRHKGKHQALRLHWSRDDLLGLRLGLTPEEEDLAADHLNFLDVFFAYSTDVLDEVHARTGARARVLRYGIRMACDQIPQGRIMDFDLTRHQGLARQAHAVIGFRGLELDTGRKIPANEVVMSLVRKITVRAMSLLADYRWALKRKDRPDPSPDLDGWRGGTKERMSRSIVRELFLALGEQAPISVDPDTEHDVIALFAALLAKGVLQGYELVALSGFNRYDGLIHVVTEGHGLRDHTDPFSIRNHNEPRGGKLRVLEFKLQFESLLQDFESRKKRPQDVDLAVCWTLPDMNVDRGSLTYTYGDQRDFREVYGMTHLWVDDGGSCSIPILCLRHFVTEQLKCIESRSREPGTGVASFRDLLTQEKEASV